MPAIRLLTWNLLAHDLYRPYAWPARLRRQALIRRLPAVGCDLACFQEVSRECGGLLPRLLPTMAWHRVWNDREEGHALAWRSEARRAIDLGWFRLAPAPRRHESRRPAGPPGSCTWARLRDHDGHDLLLATAHLSHDAASRLRDAIVLGTRLARLARGAATVLAGDFNALPDDPIFARLAALGLERMPKRPRSLHLFGLPLLAIDAVCTSQELRCERACRITGRDGPVFASDHFGLLADLRSARDARP